MHVWTRALLTGIAAALFTPVVYIAGLLIWMSRQPYAWGTADVDVSDLNIAWARTSVFMVPLMAFTAFVIGTITALIIGFFKRRKNAAGE